jgi:lysyl-tRNA synthetase class 2
LSIEDDLYQQRVNRIAEIEALGFRPYGHRFDFTHTIPQILADHGSKTAEQLEPREPVRVAGRIATIRHMGKAGFAHLTQNGERLQIYVRKDAAPEKDFELFQRLDIGDIVGVEGYLFRTRTGELSIHVERLHFLAKTLLSMPEKWHGLEDVETRYRQRYLDLIANPEVRRVFERRAKIVASLRRQLEARGFLEVETPMLQPLYGGAAARPFITHHNTLDIDLYLRIAPELYLKRLVVGGLERVYEINRNFRNEGISTQHNPEFTMLEFYQAYTDYHGMMDLSEELLRQAAIDATGSAVVEYQGEKIDFGNFRRVSMRQAVGNPELKGEALVEVFERDIESTLIQPTILYDYPVEVSPLSKNKPDEPDFVERFEIYIAGMEIGNAFTELNDPREQRLRFEMQLAMRERGDQEAHQMDEDYIRALSYGMPPAGGEGIGIDRLTMILTNSRSIRDVILFPLLRPVEHD